MRRALATVLCCSVLAGCTTSGDLYVRSPDAIRTTPVAGGLNSGGSVEMVNPGASVLFGVLVLTFGAAAIAAGHMVPHLEGPVRFEAASPDPTRPVNVQDCTQPIDLSAGNLRCR
jgi:hypothetical protein